MVGAACRILHTAAVPLYEREPMNARTPTAQAAAPAAQVKLIEQRWTAPLAKAGWTPLPNIILDKQEVLGLKPLDLNILLQIAKHWYAAESAPFPAVETLAKAIGVKARTVQRRIRAMVEAGLIERRARFYVRGGQKSNEYTFRGVIEKSTPFANEALKERERRKAAERARVIRKTPLAVVK
jgi:predicted transcriptional regulator